MPGDCSNIYRYQKSAIARGALSADKKKSQIGPLNQSSTLIIPQPCNSNDFFWLLVIKFLVCLCLRNAYENGVNGIGELKKKSERTWIFRQCQNLLYPNNY
jgi:hypothetical protein